jgi:FkbM family methyltransferase
MIASTAWLFRKLLRVLRIDVVCDVGSMNGRDALEFRDAAPHAALYAFEANPHNVAAMLADSRLAHSSIEIVPAAVSNSDGEADFYIVGSTDNDVTAWPWRGMSSLHRRPTAAWFKTSIARVSTLKLDTFLAPRLRPRQRAALWIDAEGKAYEVLEGAGGISDNVHLIHVEVETTPCIAAGQQLYPRVMELLASRGFVEVATDAAPSREQFNVLYLRASVRPGDRLRVHWYLMLAILRAFAGRSLRQLAPAYARHRQRKLAACRA